MFEGFGRTIETFAGWLVNMEALVKMITGAKLIFTGRNFFPFALLGK